MNREKIRLIRKLKCYSERIEMSDAEIVTFRVAPESWRTFKELCLTFRLTPDQGVRFGIREVLSYRENEAAAFWGSNFQPCQLCSQAITLLITKDDFKAIKANAMAYGHDYRQIIRKAFYRYLKALQAKNNLDPVPDNQTEHEKSTGDHEQVTRGQGSKL